MRIASGRCSGCITGLSEIDFEHSSHELNRPKAKRFRVKPANLNIPKIELIEVFVDLLEAENLKSKDLADEYTAFMPAVPFGKGETGN
jgi:hypothetical protein